MPAAATGPWQAARLPHSHIGGTPRVLAPLMETCQQGGQLLGEDDMDGWWSEAWMTVQRELFALPDPASTARILVRSLLAMVLGGLVGYERERRGTAAGLRTHMLVALGSALFVMVPLEAGVATADMSRVLQGVISGIGFLGAGAVIKLSQDRKIRGLTTAASIWLTAAIGAATGMGVATAALMATALALFILAHLHGLCGRMRNNNAAAEANDSALKV